MGVVCVSLNNEKNSAYPCKIDIIDEIKLCETKTKYIVGFTTHADIKVPSSLMLLQCDVLGVSLFGHLLSLFL